MDPLDLTLLCQANKKPSPEKLQSLLASLKAKYTDQDILEVICRNQLNNCALHIWRDDPKTLCPTWHELMGIYLREATRCEGHPITPYIAALGNNAEAIRIFMKYNRGNTIHNLWLFKAFIGANYYGHQEVAQELANFLFKQI